ncbi:MAG: ASKHA domain-containing protein [Lachnospiraceae bacterium]|nr:ASKHA domain-containing protein [Lachnospiraceae bacterium]
MVTVVIQMGSGTKTLYVKEGSLLLSVLRENRIIQAAPCGGKGTCGGCEVKTSLGNILACQHRLTEDITIYMSEKEEFQAVLMEDQDSVSKLQGDNSEEDEEYGIAIDIGTTTLGFALKHLRNGRMIAQWGCTNSQGQYGADVASRIVACETKDGLQTLSKCVREDIKKGIQVLLKQANLDKKQLKQIVIVGNAVMLHILQEISPTSIGKAPFHVPESSMKRINIDQVEVVLFPHAGAFIGGDIVSGAAYLKMFESERIHMLIDLGTNGEMVLGTKEYLIAAAAAAGPAFENCFRSTGTTGSKVLDLLVLNARRRILKKDGSLKPEYREKGIPGGPGLWITQSQIREIQLAKGAIRTGIELLMKTYGCEPSDIDQVYLAGGFGFYLNVVSAIKTGLLPAQFQEKIKVVGNTALSGAFFALGNEEFLLSVNQVGKKIDCRNLAEFADFQEKYLEEISYICIR